MLAGNDCSGVCRFASGRRDPRCAVNSHRVFVIPLHQGPRWSLPARRLLVRRSRGILRICPSGSSGSDLGASRVGTGHCFRRYSLARSARLPVVACWGVGITSPVGRSASLHRIGILVCPHNVHHPVPQFRPTGRCLHHHRLRVNREPKTNITMRRYLAGGHLVTQANPCILRSYVESRGEARDGVKEPRPFVLFPW